MEILLEPIQESLMTVPVLFLACLLVEYISNRDVVNKFFAQKQMSFCDSFCKNIELTAYIRYLFLNSSIIFGFR